MTVSEMLGFSSLTASLRANPTKLSLDFFLFSRFVRTDIFNRDSRTTWIDEEAKIRSAASTFSGDV